MGVREHVCACHLQTMPATASTQPKPLPSSSKALLPMTRTPAITRQPRQANITDCSCDVRCVRGLGFRVAHCIPGHAVSQDEELAARTSQTIRWRVRQVGWTFGHARRRRAQEPTPTRARHTTRFHNIPQHSRTFQRIPPGTRAREAHATGSQREGPRAPAVGGGHGRDSSTAAHMT